MKPPSKANLASAFWRELLEAQGVTVEELDEAERSGTLELLALERAILPEPPEFDLDEVVERAGADPERIRALWRALGFPDPHAGEKVFSERDVEMLRTVEEFIADGTLDEGLALMMARVIGSSLARVATAQVEAAVMRQGEVGAYEADPEAEAREVQRSAELIPMLSSVLDSVWRRHLAVAAGRRVARGDEPGTPHAVSVGFADLEGFTALAQQLPERKLADVINRFETLAYDVVSRFGGRVIKTIGDEVMFAVDDLRSGADLALTLAESYAADEALSDVRVGLAHGDALELEGDLYGPAVNLASRIVSLAYPGSVLVSSEVREALQDDPDFSFQLLRPHHLKHIGRVRLYVLRRAGEAEGEGEGRTLDRARERRSRRRDWIAEHMGEADWRRDDGGQGDDPAVTGEDERRRSPRRRPRKGQSDS